MSDPIKRNFPKADLLEVLELSTGEKHENGYTMIEDKMTGKSRWADEHQMVFEFEQKFYRASYRVGSTESQDESPWEYQGDGIECTQVEPQTKMVIVYKSVVASS